MVRNTEKYVCKDCGHKFIGMDIEWNGTADSYPVKCPKCGSLHTAPRFSFGDGILQDPCTSLVTDILQRLFKKG